MGGRELLRSLSPRETSIVPSLIDNEEFDLQLPSIREYRDKITVSKPTEIVGTTPEQRFTENDQTDPAGRWRFQLSADQFLFQRAATASWATAQTWLEFDYPNGTINMYAMAGKAGHVDLCGASGTTKGGNIVLYGVDDSGDGGIYFNTPNNAESSSVNRLIIAKGAASGYAVITFANVQNVDLGSTAGVLLSRRVYGHGDGDMIIHSNELAADATERSLSLQVLNATGDAFITVAKGSPHAATPFWTQIAPDHVPTTSELDAGHLTFGYTAATNTLTAYYNEAGAIVSLAIGVLA